MNKKFKQIMEGESVKDKRERRLNWLKKKRKKENCQVKENNNLGNNQNCI